MQFTLIFITLPRLLAQHYGFLDEWLDFLDEWRVYWVGW